MASLRTFRTHAQLARKIGGLRLSGKSVQAQARALRAGIRGLCQFTLRPATLAVPEQPFDRILLAVSPLYRESRKRYLEIGGRFRSCLVTTPRTLSSPILLESLIEYSPTESEFFWAATDPRQSRHLEHLLQLRTFSASLFHEQNHRILWRHLPSCPRDPAAMRRYLNFAESLVIATDMALGDQLGPELAPLFYWTGVTYDPGTVLGQAGLSRREYRNYLHACAYSTYLTLELYEPGGISRLTRSLFPQLRELAARAARRSGNLDQGFTVRTNLDWQKRNRAVVLKKLVGADPLVLPDDPADNRAAYLIAERWFEQIGL